MYKKLLEHAPDNRPIFKNIIQFNFEERSACQLDFMNSAHFCKI